MWVLGESRVASTAPAPFPPSHGMFPGQKGLGSAGKDLGIFLKQLLGSLGPKSSQVSSESLT